MEKCEVMDAMAALWVLVRENSPIIIGSQSLHGKFPDVVDGLLYSRKVDTILPNKAKLGRWLSDVVGEGTPFAADRGHYIDHVIPVDGLPILASGWDGRTKREPLIYDGRICGEIRFISPEDLAISKLGAGRPKDFVLLKKLVDHKYIDLSDVEKLIEELPEKYQSQVRVALGELRQLVQDGIEAVIPKDGGTELTNPKGNSAMTDHVIRYVVTHMGKDGLRTLCGPAQGRLTKETREEAQELLDNMMANNRMENGLLAGVYGPPLEVRAAKCYPGHFDPIGVYFDTDDRIVDALREAENGESDPNSDRQRG